MVTGSRLGASGIVILVGGVEYVNKNAYSVRKACSLGILTFLISYSIYLPSTLIGYVTGVLALPV
ncbi:MAG: sodium:phosphate symporter, partial [Halobacteria archaeon]|nr:sodium:phosphate symporter [Halobacteria archaeon]